MSHVIRKDVFWQLRSGMTQSCLLTYRDELRSWNLDLESIDSVLSRQGTTKVSTTNTIFYGRKMVADIHAGGTYVLLFNKGADRTVRMRRLICAFVVGVVVSGMFKNAKDCWRRSVYVICFPMNSGGWQWMIMDHVWLVRSIVLEDLYLTVDICNSTFVLKWKEKLK